MSEVNSKKITRLRRLLSARASDDDESVTTVVRLQAAAQSTHRQCSRVDLFQIWHLRRRRRRRHSQRAEGQKSSARNRLCRRWNRSDAVREPAETFNEEVEKIFSSSAATGSCAAPAGTRTSTRPSLLESCNRYPLEHQEPRKGDRGRTQGGRVATTVEFENFCPAH